MKPFKHYNARSIKETISLLAEYEGKARVNAGGTDLLGAMRDNCMPEYPEAIINIKTINGIDYIKKNKKGLKIGALAKLADIAHSPEVKESFGLLAEAVYSVASPHIRTMATIGGNLCQDIRCWYYRYPHQIGGPIQCARKGSSPCHAVRGDNRYHAILGEKKCFAVCPSDIAVALAAFDARIIIVGPEGERKIGVTDFYTSLGNDLKKDEIVREIEIPRITHSTSQRFLKFTLRKPVDFAIVSVASVMNVNEGVCTDARIVLGAVAPGPFRTSATEEFLKGRRIDEETAEEAARLALEKAQPLSRNAYKITIAQTLIKRAILGS
jgi:xanthine dehydrogenase YagS FAD-binding subunit